MPLVHCVAWSTICQARLAVAAPRAVGLAYSREVRRLHFDERLTVAPGNAEGPPRRALPGRRTRNLLQRRPKPSPPPTPSTISTKSVTIGGSGGLPHLRLPFLVLPVLRGPACPCLPFLGRARLLLLCRDRRDYGTDHHVSLLGHDQTRVHHPSGHRLGLGHRSRLMQVRPVSRRHGQPACPADCSLASLVPSLVPSLAPSLAPSALLSPPPPPPPAVHAVQQGTVDVTVRTRSPTATIAEQASHSSSCP
mmetsp:Transcript_10328/g.32675  ORF Transcript_10328/g.32675 Transcript_10328/m.32675 type:complete len:250 (-) Transcript_10328:444-1193(-)